MLHVPQGRALESVRLRATADQDQALVSRKSNDFTYLYNLSYANKSFQLLQELCAETVLWPPSCWHGTMPVYQTSDKEAINSCPLLSADLQSVPVTVWTSFPTVGWHDISQVEKHC